MHEKPSLNELTVEMRTWTGGDVCSSLADTAYEPLSYNEAAVVQAIHSVPEGIRVLTERKLYQLATKHHVAPYDIENAWRARGGKIKRKMLTYNGGLQWQWITD